MKRALVAIALLTVLTSCVSPKQKSNACIDESRINPNQVCTMQYDPVCGCNEKTYGNACEADRAGVTAYTPGPCDNK
ncbi:Kazal-type serine protease inhibitor family protein [Pontibacter sp. MBLB2868]|uniref:Kazal-type serine protease inhibitor family protein n=1 Tax=Pontibacter sp. MBLB2868 TaxID=3451555 RepID=UPI003F74C859